MLDALMGPGRDVKAEDRSIDDFTKADSCKHYLVGFCPNALLGKKLAAIKIDPAASGICPGSIYKTTVVNLDGCTLLHSKGLRTQMNDHPEVAKYRKKYEQDLQRFLAKIIREADNKVLDEKRKRDTANKPEENEFCWIKICEICGMTYKLLKRKPETDSARRGMWALGDQTLRPGDWHCPKCNEINFATHDKCLNCGHDRPAESKAALEEFTKDVRDDHPDSECCKGYAIVRAKFEELNEKYKDNDEKEADKEGEKKGRSREGRNRSRSRGGRTSRAERRDDDDRSARRGDRDGDDRRRPDRGGERDRHDGPRGGRGDRRMEEHADPAAVWRGSPERANRERCDAEEEGRGGRRGERHREADEGRRGRDRRGGDDWDDIYKSESRRRRRD